MTPTSLVASCCLLVVVLLVGLPSAWYALEIREAVEGQPMPAGAMIADGLSVVLMMWTLGVIGLVARTVRRPLEPGWFVVLIVLTLLLGGAHLELVHSKVHLACVQDGPFGIRVNCAPWLPRR